MQIHSLTPKEAMKAAGIGVVTALLLTAIMVPMMKLGISPLPKPLGLAFAETIIGKALPLPVGLLFHVAYVTVWSVVYVMLFKDRAHVSQRALARPRLVGGGARGLLSGRRLGLLRSRHHPEN